MNEQHDQMLRDLRGNIDAASRSGELPVDKWAAAMRDYMIAYTLHDQSKLGGILAELGSALGKQARS